MDNNLLKKIGKILLAEIIIFILAAIVYKIQLDTTFEDSIYAGLKWAHKVNNEYVMTADNPVVTEDVCLNMDEIKTISITGRAENINPETLMEVTVTDKASGDLLYSESHHLNDVFKSGDRDYDMHVDSAKCGAGEYVISIGLIGATSDVVVLSSNSKYSIVKEFNGDPLNKTNIITSVTYGQVRSLTGLYFLIVFVMMLAVLAGYICVMRHGRVASKGFLPVLLLLGICYQLLIPVGGAPDESWHIDTAYKYSNYMMMVPSTGNGLTIYKRECDAQQTDLLGYNAETNSYWQLLNRTFVKPQSTELVEVGFFDASGNVPGIVYFPMALGITVGRLLGLSGMLTYILGRYFAFICYALLMYAAILIIPYGKNVIALISVLPISLQQGGSASYDSMIIGLGTLYTAGCLKVMDKDSDKKYIIPTVISGVLLVISKGGVYSPLLIFLIYALVSRKSKNEGKKLSKKTICLLTLGVVLVIAGAMFLYKDVIATMNVANRPDANIEDMHYTISYFISNPTGLICMLWETPFVKFDEYVTGLMGGILGWNSIKLKWLFVLPMVLVMLLFANIEKEKIELPWKKRVYFLIPCALSFLAIMVALLLANTAFGEIIIEGVQGRYILPFAGMLFILTGNSMINVDKANELRLWKFVMYLQSLLVMQVFVNVCR